ncbi:hypothetical protein DI392_15195 [Vibrio albus]|uniref:GGDEF domain-containing protein n=1 Tax=Vibrio albus TaxID=2200953 RepID=A0A2U3B6Q8_9VIBR|nr:GGDEF domain-containing protein [Vibrio albus]PWI32405.1 hypothetical protein DI392_15195 [Vibrio albus]
MPLSSKTPDHLKPSIIFQLQKSARFELFLGLAIVVLLIALSVFLKIELIEKFYAFTRAHEEWELDELFLSLFWLGLGAIIYVIRRMRDIKILNREIVKHAYYDPITHLPNRTLALDRLEKQIHSAKRHSEHVVVAFLDFDNFKAVNDTYGHDVGDALIKQVGSRLSNVIRSDETIARLGGDEFLLIAMFKHNLGDVPRLLSRVQATQDKPYMINNQAFNIQYSIGISTYPEDGETSQALIKAADIAMYKAKRKGSGYYAFYSEDPNKPTQTNSSH